MFKNLKSLFVVTEEDTATPEEVNSNSESENSSQNISQGTKNPANEMEAKLDNTILEKLFKAIEDNNQPGMDYLEFRQALKSLANLPMEESTKFQSAYATASTMGITLQKLLDSIDFYKKVLGNEEDKFKKALSLESASNIDDKLKLQQNLEQNIKAKSEQIKKLTEEIRNDQTEIEKIQKNIETARVKLNKTSGDFEFSLRSIVFQFDTDAEKLKKYIK